MSRRVPKRCSCESCRLKLAKQVPWWEDKAFVLVSVAALIMIALVVHFVLGLMPGEVVPR